MPVQLNRHLLLEERYVDELGAYRFWFIEGDLQLFCADGWEGADGLVTDGSATVYSDGYTVGKGVSFDFKIFDLAVGVNLFAQLHMVYQLGLDFQC